MMGPPPSRSLRGAQKLYCGLYALSCSKVDAYAAHMRGAKLEKVFELHTMPGKSIPLNPHHGVSSTPKAERASLRPQSSRKITPVTAHTPQAWLAPAYEPSSPVLPATHLIFLC